MKNLLSIFLFFLLTVTEVVAQTNLDSTFKGTLCTIEVEVKGPHDGPFVCPIQLPYTVSAGISYGICGPGAPNIKITAGNTADVVLKIPELYMIACEAESTEAFLELYVRDTVNYVENTRIIAWYYIRLLVKRGW